MAERPEDLNLPNAVVTRIIKEALPAGVNVGKDARLAISKAASVFVLYATSCANNNALRSKRKTITVNDVFTALEDMEFDSFIDPLRTELDGHKKSQATKKSKKAAKLSVSKEAIGGDAEINTREAEADSAAGEGGEQELPVDDESDTGTDEQAKSNMESRMDTSS